MEACKNRERRIPPGRASAHEEPATDDLHRDDGICKQWSSGISEEVQEKIFNPFFTTKPTGQGTGLGLSLSYDIIKSHHGEIKVESAEGEGTEFVITLPV